MRLYAMMMMMKTILYIQVRGVNVIVAEYLALLLLYDLPSPRESESTTAIISELDEGSRWEPDTVLASLGTSDRSYSVIHRNVRFQ
jgi:hypothetical protein